MFCQHCVTFFSPGVGQARCDVGCWMSPSPVAVCRTSLTWTRTQQQAIKQVRSTIRASSIPIRRISLHLMAAQLSVFSLPHFITHHRFYPQLPQSGPSALHFVSNALNQLSRMPCIAAPQMAAVRSEGLALKFILQGVQTLCATLQSFYPE